MKNIVILLLLSITVMSCNSNESELIEKDVRVQISEEAELQNETREKGQIPISLNYHTKLNNIKGNDFAHVNLLKQFKKNHGSQDYYNNLFELTSFELLQSPTIKELGKDEIKFLLEEMESVESNMLNIKSIPIVLNLSLSKNIISKDEYLNISKKMIEKNKKEINQIKWKNLAIKNEKIEQITQLENQLYYLRNKY